MSVQPGGRVHAQLVAETTDGVWTSCWIWPTSEFQGNAKVFELGEPIYLDGLTSRSGPNLEDQIYYVVGFFQDASGYGVEVGFERSVAEFTASVACLRKLDPLTRLAAEASAGPLP